MATFVADVTCANHPLANDHFPDVFPRIFPDPRVLHNSLSTGFLRLTNGVRTGKLALPPTGHDGKLVQGTKDSRHRRQWIHWLPFVPPFVPGRRGGTRRLQVKTSG